MSKKAVTRAWLDVKHRFAEVQAESIYALVNAIVDQKIKEALTPKQCEHKRFYRDESGRTPDTCADCGIILSVVSQ